MSTQVVICTSCLKGNRVDLEKAQTTQPHCGHCQATLPIHHQVQQVNDQTLPLLISKSDLPIVVDFWAPWCGPCRMFAPTFEATAQKMGDQFVFAKLNTDENRLMGSEHNIMSIPTLLVFKGGEEVNRVSGALPAPRFEQFLKGI